MALDMTKIICEAVISKFSCSRPRKTAKSWPVGIGDARMDSRGRAGSV